MHRNPYRRDAEATKAAGFASRFSYVSRRIHPGTDHPCVYLAGFKDCEAQRNKVLFRDGYRCVDCGKALNPDLPSWFSDAAHLAHGGNTKISRCWCVENLKTKCLGCHGQNDHHGRFGTQREPVSSGKVEGNEQTTT